MSRVLYLDVIGGAAGDMLLAALIDAGAPLQPIRDAVELVLPGRFEFDTEIVKRGGLRARLLRIESGPAARKADPEAAGHGRLTARLFHDLVAAVDGSGLSPRLRSTAAAVLERIGEAESTVHGIDVEEVSLHQLGDDDTLLDVVGIAAALEQLRVDEVLVSAIPLGSGRALGGMHVHGSVPLPATVTLELLRGFPVRGEGADETVTPTAAAVFAALGKPAPMFPSMTIEAIGYGAGNDDPPNRANVVRAILGAAVPDGPARGESGEQPGPVVRELAILEANLDDLTPQLLADAAQALLSAGALDAWTTPVQMKKGRAGFVLSALCDPTDEPRLRTVFFEATPTLGLRSHRVRRSELDRRTVAVPLQHGSVRVKIGLLDGRIITATPEHDDVVSVATRSARPVREVHEEAEAGARALRFAEAGS
jgi:pyridinium-3,5-bisthiocarboxylic acid mononucleotide nickel chelatase